MSKDNRYDELTSEQVRDKVVRYLVRGHAMEQIAEKLNLDTTYVVNTWKDYVTEQYAMPEDERWLLHERRLELLLQKATGLIEDGLDEEFGPNALNAALNVLTKLEELQGLNNARKKDAEARVAVMTQQQVGQMLQILEAVKMELAQALPPQIQANTKAFWTPDTISELFDQQQLEVMEEKLG